METGKKGMMRIRYRCSLPDGKVYDVGERSTLDVVPGETKLPPALERALAEMKPGERRTVRVPAVEANLFPYPKGAHFEKPTPPGVGYEFGPGEAGDVSVSIPPTPIRDPLPPGADMIFEVELLEMQ
jgi:FKBP-type peptidyl-prolyl cis-trans isomerase